MPKTYGTVTTFTAGSVLTAAQLNVASTAVNNLVVPAAVQVRRTSDVNPYTSGASISWSDSVFDTDGMFSSGTAVTINTTGLYAVSFGGFVTGTATITLVNPVVMSNGNIVLTNNTPINAGVNAYFHTSGIFSFTATTVISTRVDLTGGSAYVLKGSATEGIGQTRLAITWIGRTS